MPSNHVFDIRMLGGEWATNMTCENANCEAHRKGWVSVLDVTTEDGAWQATFIKERSGRKFYEWSGTNALEEALKLQASGDITVTEPLRAMLAQLAPGLVVFVFPPGQQCFRIHEDREVKFHHVTRAGAYEHANGRDFNEDSNETADRLHILRQRG